MNSRNKQMFSHLPTYDINSFTWIKGHGTALMSDFNSLSSGIPMYGRIWKDAIDAGFTVMNHKTGREVLFRLKESTLTSDVYESLSLLDIPNKTVTITLYND